MDFEARIEKLQEMIDNSKRIVFFGGAGVSTESGIPDFRSKDGLYNQHDVQFEKYEPEYLLSYDCLFMHPKVFFEYYRQKMDCREIQPNIVHYKLAKLEESGKLSGIVTQNIDGLHQKAGSKAVYELHGTTERAYCTKCGKGQNPNILFDSADAVPKCECGGMLRPDVTLYGENLPKDAWDESILALKESDLLIIGGTSLVVYPANLLISYYCGDIVIINHEETHEDKHATLLFRESLGRVFEKIQV